MAKTFIKSAILLMCCSILFSCNQSNTITLFNGENLEGWINYGEEKWYVENGELICESGPSAQYGYLGTEEYSMISN